MVLVGQLPAGPTPSGQEAKILSQKEVNKKFWKHRCTLYVHIRKDINRRNDLVISPGPATGADEGVAPCP